jgi:hypothetical protein
VIAVIILAPHGVAGLLAMLKTRLHLAR